MSNYPNNWRVNNTHSQSSNLMQYPQSSSHHGHLPIPSRQPSYQASPPSLIDMVGQILNIVSEMENRLTRIETLIANLSHPHVTSTNVVPPPVIGQYQNNYPQRQQQMTSSNNINNNQQPLLDLPPPNNGGNSLF